MKNNLSATIKRDFSVNKSLYLMAAPIAAYFIIFKYVPMYGLLMAFQNYSPRLGIAGSSFVGLKNFIQFFNSPSFWIILRNTLKISFATLVFGFPAPILLALLINELRNAKMAKVIQNATYMPHFISLVVACGLIKIFTGESGIIAALCNGITGSTGALLNSPRNFIPIYVISNIWQEIGWGSIIYLSALTAIDESLYEAAKVDGAGRLRQTWHITIPGILPTISILLIMRMGGILNVGFEKILLLYNDATMDVADVISTYVYRRGLVDLSYSYSAAVGMFNSVINVIFLVASNIISKKISGSGLW